MAFEKIREIIFFNSIMLLLSVLSAVAQNHPMTSTSSGMTGVATPTPYGNQPSGDPNSEADALNRQLVRDQALLRRLMETGNVDAKLGEMAQTNSQNDDIKRLGKKIVEDRIQLNVQLEPAATALGITSSKELSRKGQQLVAKFESLNGPNFDEEFIKAMVKDHRQDLKDLNALAKTSRNPAMTDAARGGESTVSQDLQMIEQIAQSHDQRTDSKPKKVSGN